jgi:DNA modification methylase
MNDFFKNSEAPKGPVKCLGQTFPNEEARREHFLAILREKLKDPDFRRIEGFPIGADEDILALSDPPYYTACPNPFIEAFMATYGHKYDPSVPYSKMPFAANVSEGKNDPIYNAHSYHTKVPHKAIMRFILHYTQPGDVVFDCFCGTGMTGVAAQLCGNRAEVQSLGYRVDADGTILASEIEDGVDVWKPFSKLGARSVVLNDLAPAATFIAYNYNAPVDVYSFEQEAKKTLAQMEAELGWMYETLHSDGKTKGHINYTVWSDIYNCPECAGLINFWKETVDTKTDNVVDEFPCPHCSAMLDKKKLDRVWESELNKTTGEFSKIAKQEIVLINYSVGTTRFEKIPDKHDLEVVNKAKEIIKSEKYPKDKLPNGFNTRQPIESHGFITVNCFYTHRTLAVLSKFSSKINGPHQSTLNFLFGSILPKLTKMNRYMRQHGSRALVGPMANTLYVPAISVENNVIDQLQFQLKKIVKALSGVNGFLITTSSSTKSEIPSSSVDYIFLDPPFGGNIMYSEMSFLRESWLKLRTNQNKEAIENSVQKKGINEYRELMTACFSDAFRVLKPGRWMTVEFSNTKAAVWNTLQLALQEAGFVVAGVAALDKGRGGFHSMTSTTAVKQDLIISVYKPNGELEERFNNASGSEDSAWDFVRTHLKYLLTVKVSNGQLDFITERDPRIIFDRLVAWFVRHNFQVPLSSHEFQAGLSQRFSERDGMVFLPDQVLEYDRKRIKFAQAPQVEMFIADERSAIDWLTDFLKRKPSTYQDIHPEFIRQLGAGWRKHEAKPELSQLLESNFLIYDSKIRDILEVPSQIHSYLSTNWSEYRNLEKSDPRLKAKAADRWYVPDPNKAQELEKLREKSLLKEFEIYKTSTLRKLKEFRLEAVRAGFKHCWGSRDYATIMAVAKKIPDDVLQEDEKLLLWYDQAVTRTEDNI